MGILRFGIFFILLIFFHDLYSIFGDQKGELLSKALAGCHFWCHCSSAATNAGCSLSKCRKQRLLMAMRIGYLRIKQTTKKNTKKHKKHFFSLLLNIFYHFFGSFHMPVRCFELKNQIFAFILVYFLYIILKQKIVFYHFIFLYSGIFRFFQFLGKYCFKKIVFYHLIFSILVYFIVSSFFFFRKIICFSYSLLMNI